MRSRVGAGRGVAAVVVLAVGLGGCGGDEDASGGYCEVLREERTTLGELAERAGEPGTDVLTPTLEAIGRLREAAPAELADEYDTVYYAWEGMVEAVREAGVDPAEFRPGETPDGVSAAQARRLTQVATALGGARVVSASAGLEDHARQVCDVELRM